MSFQDDIQGQNTQLYPIVTIEPPEYMENLAESHSRIITLSTNNVSLGHIHKVMGNTTLNLDSVNFKPLLLNIPSIKESIDIESRKFKISNVSLNISNVEYEGNRFTDILSDTSLINWKCSIQFVSPSTTAYSTIFGVTNFTPVESFYDRYKDDEDATMMTQMVYQGIIRRISHDDTKVKVGLEDLTEKLAHKNLPQTYLGTNNDIPDKYKNKPIPMVYGYVDRSPCVLKSSGGTYIIPDTNQIDDFITSNVSLIGNIVYPLYISNGDTYANVPGWMLTNSNHANSIGWDLDQYVLGENIDATIEFTTSTKQYETVDSPFAHINCRLFKLADTDLFINNLLFVASLSSAKSFDVLLPPSDWVDTESAEEVTSIMDLSDTDFDNLATDDETFVLFDNQRTYEIGGSGSLYNMAMPFLHFKYPVDRSFTFAAESTSFFFNGLKMDREDDFAIPAGDYSFIDPTGTFTHDEDYFMGTALVDMGYGQMQESSAQADFLFQFTNSSGNNIWGSAGPNGTDFVCIKGTETNAASNNLTPKGFDGFKLGFTNVSFGDYYAPRSITIKVRAKHLAYWRWGIIKGTADKGFYVDIKGRVNTYIDHPDGLGVNTLIENPIDIIYDLVRSELGHHAIDEDEYEEAKAAHDEWKFGFTVNKKISSKSLIADIAKSTKCFPKFKNDGSFGFNTIKDSYTAPPAGNPENTDNDYAKATQIKESEVISYSFKKTKPEQLIGKIDVAYHKNYSNDNYMEKTLAWSPDYPLDYYGIEDDSAYLGFESDYIRNRATAENLRNFLLLHNQNDHLLFSLKLPLQHINLEIGDLVKFRELFGGVKAYGIDYRVVDSPNEQYYYPLFMVTATTKNLDSVSVECMQLHHLLLGENTLPNGWGEVGINDDGTEGTFYFPDADQTIISIGDIEEFTITPPTITYLNGDAIQDITIDTEEGIYTAFTPEVKAIDGDWNQSDITEHITVEASIVGGEVIGNFENGDAHPLGDFNEETQILVTYSVESPTTGFPVTSVTHFINIDVSEFQPQITISSESPNTFTDVAGILNHDVPIVDNDWVNYLEKYVYDLAEITYSAYDQNEGDLTNDVEFAKGYLLNDVAGGASADVLPPPDPFANARYAFINGEVGLGADQIPEGVLVGDTYSESIIAFVRDSGGWFNYKEWIVNVIKPEIPLMGDISQDGNLNIIDIVIMVDYIIEDIPMSTQEFLTSDMNFDGAINVNDIMGIVWWIWGQE